MASIGSGLYSGPGGLLSNMPSAQAFFDYLVLTRPREVCRVTPRQHSRFPVLWSCTTRTRTRAVTARKSVAATPISSWARPQGIRSRTLGILSGAGRRTSPSEERSLLGSSMASSAARAASALRSRRRLRKYSGFPERHAACVFSRRFFWHSSFPHARWREPTRGSGWNHLLQIRQGRLLLTGHGALHTRGPEIGSAAITRRP